MGAAMHMYSPGNLVAHNIYIYVYMRPVQLKNESDFDK